MYIVVRRHIKFEESDISRYEDILGFYIDKENIIRDFESAVEEKLDGVLFRDGIFFYPITFEDKDDNYQIIINKADNTCSSYHVEHIKTRMTEFEKGVYYGKFGCMPEDVYYGERGVCWGTREQDECYCGGDTSKCTFYKDKKSEKHWKLYKKI